MQSSAKYVPVNPIRCLFVCQMIKWKKGKRYTIQKAVDYGSDKLDLEYYRDKPDK